MNLGIFSKAVMGILGLVKGGFDKTDNILKLVTVLPDLINTSKEVVASAGNAEDRKDLLNDVLTEFDKLTGKGGVFRVIPSLSEDDEEIILDAISILIREGAKKV